MMKMMMTEDYIKVLVKINYEKYFYFLNNRLITYRYIDKF